MKSKPIVKIEEQYYLGEFDNDLYAKISNYGKYGIANIDGEIVVPCIYDDIAPIEKIIILLGKELTMVLVLVVLDMLPVLQNGKWGVINKQNQLI